MAIAHAEQFIASANPGSTTDPFDITCAATTTPNGVVVIITQNGTSGTSDQIASVTYGISTGAVTLTRRRFDTEATETGGVYIYWAGGGVVFPSGTQTVRIDRSAISSTMGAVVSTMTVAAGQQVAVDSDATGTSASVANPSWTHTSLVDNVVAYLGIHSGLTTMTSTPATNWTLQHSIDAGQQGRGFAQRTLATAGALAPGWTASTADDFRGSSIAFKEVPITVSAPDPIHAAIAGRPGLPVRPSAQILSGD